jgi:putative ABC transport system permease protein
VITQVALAVVLLAGSGLMLKSFWNAQQAPLGFDPRGILTMNLPLPAVRYDNEEKIAGYSDPPGLTTNGHQLTRIGDWV